MANVLRVLLSGGGTGGHIYPLVSVADALRQLSAEYKLIPDIRYFGAPGQFQFYLEKNDIRIHCIAASKLRRYFSFLNFFDFFKFIFGFTQALWKLFWFMPDVMFSKGGPGVIPIVLAARFYRIPIVVHESDAIPGMTNRFTAKRAVLIEVAFAEALPYFTQVAPTKEVHVTGAPVRNILLSQDTRANARLSLGLLDERAAVLILGGSQGAQSLNDFVLENSELLFSKFEIIHQVGARNFTEYQQTYNFVSKNHPVEIKKNYLPFPFLDDRKMALVLHAADIIISRAGAGAISEIAASGKPAILVPLPDSANDHQRENAYAYAKTGAALVIEEENLLPNLVITQIEKILSNKAIYERMSSAARAFYKGSVAEIIAKDIIVTSGILANYTEVEPA